MNLQALRDLFRIRADDVVEPQLWEDGEVDQYLNDAQREAAVRARLIKDSTTTAVTQIAIDTTSTDYPLHTSILSIERVKLASQEQPLGRTTVDELDRLYPDWESQVGMPRFFVEDNGRIRLVPKSAQVDTMNLVVYRLPLADMKAEDDSPEIHEMHHARMVDWALRCAYLKPDQEKYDPTLAARYEAAFTGSFGIRQDANVQRKQREHKPTVVRSCW